MSIGYTMSINPEAPHIKPWVDNKSLTVINMFAGPCTGKSTTAAELFALMKKQGLKVELIHEIAKDCVWERWDHIFREQDWIFGHQHRLQRRLVGHDVDYVVLDSSLLYSIFYAAPDFPPSFKQFVRDVFDSYTNINFFLQRGTEFEYVQAGRNQDLATAQEIDQQLLECLNTNNIEYHMIQSGSNAALAALDIVMKLHQRKTPIKNR